MGVDVIQEHCTFASDEGRRWLLVWPSGTVLDARTNPPVIRGSSGQALVTVGDVFSFNGNLYSSDQVDQIRSALDAALPSDCVTDKIALVDQKVTPLQPEPASWRIDQTSPPDATSTTVHILLTEQECAQGRDPFGRLQTPTIDYRSTAIAITIDVLAIGGRCSNPEYPLVVQLEQPIGDRTLIDGSDGSARWSPAGIPSASPDLGLDNWDARPATDQIH
jgi:hypothetical protein